MNVRNAERRTVICDYIRQSYKEKGTLPTVREIGRVAGLSSLSTTAGYLNRMVREGILKKTDTRYRVYMSVDS